MIDRPNEIYTDEHIVVRTQECLRLHAGGPSTVQPAREQVLAALNSRTG